MTIFVRITLLNNSEKTFFLERKFFKNNFRYFYVVIISSSLIYIAPLKSQDVTTEQPEITNTHPDQEDLNLLEELLENEDSENCNQYQSSSYINQTTNSEDEQSLKKLLQEIWDSFKEDRFGSKDYKLTMKQRWELTKDVMGALSIAAKAKWSADLENTSRDVYANEYKGLSKLQKVKANARLISSGIWGGIKSHKVAIGSIVTVVAAIIIYKKYFKKK